MEVCTIIAKNYVAHARVLARSLADHNPGTRLRTLVIDDFERYIDPAAEPFDVLTPADIGCEQFIHMAMRYTVLELSTAVKPWLLRHLLERSGGPVTYLDPDIKIYGSLQALDDAARRHGVVLIPHNDKPLPEDGRRPSQVDIMIAGVYNLGYVTLGPGVEVDRLLDWWSDRLLRDCRVDPIWGYFVDQRWFDLVPGFLTDMEIVREPQYNLAYWNLHSRKLEQREGCYYVDGMLLAFFHFSGFDPSKPRVLSRHQSRIDVAANPVLEQLLAEYGRAVMAEGHETSRGWPYTYRALGDGTEIDDTVRALYDEYASEHDGERPSPFTLEGAVQFERWFKSQTPDAPPGVNRVLSRVYADRDDLRAAYPELEGGGHVGLLEWAKGAGSQELPLLKRALPTEAEPRNGLPVERYSLGPAGGSLAAMLDVPWGINVLSDFSSDVQASELARRLIAALDGAGIPAIAVQSDTARPGRTQMVFDTMAPDDAPFAVNLLLLDEGALPEFASQVSAKFFAGRYTVAVMLCAAGGPAEHLLPYESVVDEVWVPSGYVRALVEPHAVVPVHGFTVSVSPPAAVHRSRADLGLAESPFTFLVLVDHRTSLERQNPLAAIDAFKRLEGDLDARLVIGCLNADSGRHAHGELLAAAEHPRIDVIARELTRDEQSSLIDACDCLVSLHRAEAFGISIAEAMWRGKPVIATRYSGNLEYMTEENSLLADCEIVPAPPGGGLAEEPSEWAEADVEHAAKLMQSLLDDRALVHRLGSAGAHSIWQTNSPGAAVTVVNERLESIRATGYARRAADPARERAGGIGALELRFRQGPTPAPNAFGGAARESLRKAVLRVMQPYTVYQDDVNRDLVKALEELCDVTVRQRKQLEVARAERMALARRQQQLELKLEELGSRAMTGIDNVRGDITLATEGIDDVKRMLTFETDRDLYLALAELSRRHAEIASVPAKAADAGSLTAFELRAFSQNGEDGVIAEILRRVGAPSRFFIEFGIESGREGNCVYLADVAGWSGLFMEADDGFYRRLARKYGAQSNVRTIEAMVGADNVESLFEAGAVPAELDVLSIDVDGQDYWIWEAVDSYRPRVVVIEYNSALNPQRRLVQPKDVSGWDDTDYYGASLGSLVALGERKGYRLVHTELSGVNAFFVRSDLAGDAFPAPEEVAMRGAPNYFQHGHRHPPARPGRRYLDLDTGELVPADSKGY